MNDIMKIDLQLNMFDESFMVITNKKPLVDTQNIAIKESKHSTTKQKDYITKEWGR